MAPHMCLKRIDDAGLLCIQILSRLPHFDDGHRIHPRDSLKTLLAIISRAITVLSKSRKDAVEEAAFERKKNIPREKSLADVLVGAATLRKQLNVKEKEGHETALTKAREPRSFRGDGLEKRVRALEK